MRFTIIIGIWLFGGIANRFLPIAERVSGNDKFWFSMVLITIIALTIDII